MNNEEEKTIITQGHGTKNSAIPTPQYVRNLLGDPDATDDNLITTFTPIQKLGLGLVRVADDIHALRQGGCAMRAGDLTRIRRIEGTLSKWKFGVIVLGVAGGVIIFLLEIAKYVKLN